MKSIITLILTLSLISKVEAKKRVLPYEILIGGADLIVEGEIVDVSEGFYKFQITDFLKNKSKQTIKIQMFSEWACDSRVMPAKKGQKLLLFLAKSDYEFYQIINGSTGELFVESVTEVFQYDFEFESYKDIKNGIKRFAESFDYHGDLYFRIGTKQTFEMLKSSEELAKMESESRFFKSLAEKVFEQYHII